MTKHPIKSAAITLISLAAAAALFSPPAAARDWGGDGLPSNCGNSWTVKSVPIKGNKGRVNGQVIGYLELRWSEDCHANWSRVTLYGGLYSDNVTVEQTISSEGRSATSIDFVHPGTSGTTTWTPMVRLTNRDSTACVSAWVSSDFGTPVFGTTGERFCY